jgi:hypothetical protein
MSENKVVKVLRVGVIYNGRILDEQLFRKPETIYIGAETGQSPEVMSEVSAKAGRKAAQRVTPLHLLRDRYTGTPGEGDSRETGGSGGWRGIGRGRKPHGGRSRSRERLPGSAGSRP